MPHSVKINRGLQIANPSSQKQHDEKPKENAALYVRASTEEQIGDQQVSTLDAQLSACRHFALIRGFEVTLEIEETRSGRSLSKRPELLSILDAIDRGEIQHLIVKNITRLSRSVSDYSNMVERVAKAGGNIWLVDQPELSAGSATGDLIRNILASVSQFESQMISERVKSKNYYYFSLGLPVSKPPDGYKWCEDNSHTWIVNEERAPLIKSMFVKYLETGSMPGLIQWLQDNGHKSPNGQNYIMTSIHKLLTNRAFVGECYWEPQGWYQGRHDPLISSKLFEDVQELLQTPKRPVGTSKRHEYVYILPDRIFGEGVDPEGNKCWVSLSPDYTEKKQKDGSFLRHFYYRSKAHRRRINNAKCKCVIPNLPADILEERILEVIEEEYPPVLLDELFTIDVRKTSEERGVRAVDDVKSIDRKIHTLTEQMHSFTLRLGDPALNVTNEVISSINENVSRIMRDISNLKEERSRCQGLIVSYQNVDTNVKYLKDLLHRLRMAHDSADRIALKGILEILISKVTVTNEEMTVEIRVLPQLKPVCKPYLGGDETKLPRADSNH